ncbi:MAG: hypothetical protein AB7G93_01185 [Bdellovibrionales bacterium]
MKAFTLILLAFLSSLMLGCKSTRSKSLLEERAGYEAKPPNVNLSGSGSVQYVPTRVPEKVIVPWLHAKELPSKDYFWGAWISVVVTPETWEMRTVEVAKAAKPGAKRTQNKPQIKPGGKPMP